MTCFHNHKNINITITNINIIYSLNWMSISLTYLPQFFIIGPTVGQEKTMIAEPENYFMSDQENQRDCLP